jgi:hypothetical protein
MTVDMVLGFVSGQPRVADLQKVADVRASLTAWSAADSEFWPFAQLQELEIYVALCAGQLGDALNGVIEGLADLWSRKANPREWASVRDQARFTLRPYAEGPRAASEQAAAAKLRQVLEAYANPEAQS